MATMTEIEVAAKSFSEARAALAKVCGELRADLLATRAKHMERLKSAVAIAKTRHGEVAGLVQQSPELFKRPRSFLFNGVKLGYEKGKGALLITDVVTTLKLIKKHFPDKSDVLIKTTEKPVKKALQQLKADELKKLAIEVTATGDVVFVVDTAAEVDKLVAAFLKEESEPAEGEGDED